MSEIRSTWRGRMTAGLLAVALTSHSTLSLAQTDDERAGARAAASEGAKAFSESRWADAIDLFSRAQSLVKAPPHLLYIARSHEKLGQLVKARENYLQIKRANIADDAPPAFKDAKQAAEAELAALEPRLPYVTVNVQGAGAAQVTVTQDGVQVPPALVGVPRPVDPGEHKFQAFAKDMESEVVALTVKEGGKESVALTLVSKPGAGVPPGGAGAADGAATPSGGDGAGDRGTTSPGSNGMKIGGYVALGVGAVGLGLGTVFALKASGKYSDADDLFDKSGCGNSTGAGSTCDKPVQDEIVALDEDGDSAKTLSYVGFGVGIVGIGAGVTLLILSSGSSKSSARPEAPRVMPWIGYRSAGITGHF
ncbi:MAG: hypothetical protein IPM35_03685 [Myxococcales bacterium]|nr:hypothetical protein [Myxococcales bacterium]